MTHRTFSFIRDVVPKLKHPFVLVTGDTDASNPRVWGGSEALSLYDELWKNPLFLHMYAVNCDCLVIPEKMSCLPLGLANAVELEEKLHVVQLRTKNSTSPRQNAALLSFSLGDKWYSPASRKVRKQLQEIMCKWPSVKCPTKLDPLQYYSEITNARFVPSPVGVGADCYRSWEAMLLGAVPVVESQPSLDSIFADLPVLIVRKFADLKPEDFSETRYNEIRGRKWNEAKLYVRYWLARFRSHLSGT